MVTTTLLGKADTPRPICRARQRFPPVRGLQTSARSRALQKTTTLKNLRFVACTALLISGLALPASATELKGYEIIEGSVERGFGTTSGLALTLTIEGVGTLTVGQANGYVAFDRETQTQKAPVVPDALLRKCSASGAVRIGGTDMCLDRAKLAEAGVKVSGDKVSESELFLAGVTTRRDIDSVHSFAEPLADASKLLAPREGFLDSQLGVKPNESTAPANPQGLGRATTALVPGVLDSSATCDARTGGGDINQQDTALTVPAPLSPVVTGNIGKSTCSVLRGGSSKALPTLNQAWGEVHLNVTASQTVVDSVPAVQDVLSNVSGSVPEPVRTLLAAINENLDAAPLVTVDVAKGNQTVSASESGVVSTSVAGDVLVDVLGGIAQIAVSRSNSSASVTGAGPAAEAVCSIATVKVVNFTTPDPTDYIEQNVGCPNQKLTLLEGVAGVGDALRVALQTGVTNKSTDCSNGLCKASAGATVLTLELLSDPLPRVTLKIASTDTYAQVSNQTKSSAVALPVTGAGAARTIAVGVGVAVLALASRRRLFA